MHGNKTVVKFRSSRSESRGRKRSRSRRRSCSIRDSSNRSSRSSINERHGSRSSTDNPYHDCVYHYTNLQGIVPILQSMKLKASSGNTAYNVCGQYFTSLGPNTDPDFLRNNNWDDSSTAEDLSSRADFYVQIPKKHLPNLMSLSSHKASGRVVNIYANDDGGQPLELYAMTDDPPLFGYTRPKQEITRDDIPELQQRLSRERLFRLPAYSKISDGSSRQKASSRDQYRDSVYCYTDLRGIKTIIQQLQINASLNFNNATYHYYFTSLGPDTDPRILNEINWNGKPATVNPCSNEFYVQIPMNLLPGLKRVSSFQVNGKVVKTYVKTTNFHLLRLKAMASNRPLIGYTRPASGEEREITLDNLTTLQERFLADKKIRRRARRRKTRGYQSLLSAYSQLTLND